MAKKSIALALPLYYLLLLSSATAQYPIDAVWPPGTSVLASSTHSPLTDSKGHQITFSPRNAIDGYPGTKWNDDTVEKYPDILTIQFANSTNLAGLCLLSENDGFPADYTVETLVGASRARGQKKKNRERENKYIIALKNVCVYTSI